MLENVFLYFQIILNYFTEKLEATGGRQIYVQCYEKV